MSGADTKDSKPTVVEALAAVMEDVRAVGKGDRNTQQNYQFRGIDAVVNAVGPIFRKHKIVAVPVTESVNYRDVQTSNGKPSRECTVTVRYRFYGPAGDYIDAVTPGESMDFGDKGAPKAMSVAYRIALLQALCLPTHDTDPDAESYERAHGSGQPPQQRQPDQRNAQPSSNGNRAPQKSEADEARAALRSACEHNGWDMRRVAASFQQRTGQDIATTQDADAIRTVLQALVRNPVEVLGEPQPAGAGG